jgi:alkanesulfonate monooxygenase SsuD/methylene tetrahydromethanopterin reductase-like flavin-dependent oxidoreductase (luciferase family)
MIGGYWDWYRPPPTEPFPGLQPRDFTPIGTRTIIRLNIPIVRAPLKLGLALPHYDFSFPGPAAPGRATFERVAAYAGRAEALGFHQVWVSDHFWLDLTRYGGPPGRQGTPEAWVTLTGLAMRTNHVRLGSLVLANGMRPPTLLAKMIATLDQLAGGRIDVGLGAGWNELEFTEHELEYPGAGERLARLEEALTAIKVLLGAELGSWQGTFYRAEQAPVVPGPVQRPWPPLWVGGKGDRLLGVVARVADGWNLAWRVEPDHYRDRVALLERRLAAAGRPAGAVRRSLGLNTLLGRDADDLAERWRRLQAWAPAGTLERVSLADWAVGRLVGTPDQVAAQLAGWSGLGVEQVIVSFSHLPFAVFEDEQLDLAAELVIPRLAGLEGEPVGPAAGGA